MDLTEQRACGSCEGAAKSGVLRGAAVSGRKPYWSCNGAGAELMERNRAGADSRCMQLQTAAVAGTVTEL